MGALKTILAVIATSAAITAATQAAALPHSPTKRAELFAQCAGWLLALEEQQWLFDGPASEQTARYRAAFLDLLEATIPAATEQGLPAELPMSWRVIARAEQRTLLQQARFATDPLARAPADATARARIESCIGLLPAS
jgi:hypothetical protein